MAITGIICEYNPLHRGHSKQLSTIRSADPVGSIVCLMSGNFVQRGMPAILHKSYRAKAAIICGADLVLELPVTAALSSAEGFADAGVSILSGFCDQLCFGAETADKSLLFPTAEALLTQEFSDKLRCHLDEGLSFPAARQAAMQTLCPDASILQQPNNILAIEYCKAIIRHNSSMDIFPIMRQGSYHAVTPDAEDPSATFVRKAMQEKANWMDYVPDCCISVFENAPLHTLKNGERAMLARLRTMTDADFEALPYGSEGLWRKLMHATRSQANLEAIAEATKSKRYTRTRIDRMLMCAFLGISDADIKAPPAYARVLAFNDRGRQLLKAARKTFHLPNIGQPLLHPYEKLENRCADLYALFADTPESAGTQQALRVYFHQ